MDEFTSIGKVEILASSVSYMAGYNIRLLPIIQSMAQLDATYGKDVSRTIITNHALQIIYAPREQQDANDYSEMLRYTTVRKQSMTRGRDVSKSHSDERRALMLPQELKAMGTDKEVILFEGIPHPVKCGKIRYYEDKRFTSRLLSKIDVPVLEWEGRVPVGKKTVALIAVVGLAMAGLSQAATAAKDSYPAAQKRVHRAPAHDEVLSMAGGFVEYISRLSDAADISLDTFQTYVKAPLERRGRESGFNSKPFPEGDWVTVIFQDADTSVGPSATLHFGSDQGENNTSVPCRMSYADLEGRLKHAGFIEARDSGALGDVIVWLFLKNDIRIEVSTRTAIFGTERMSCVRTIKAQG